MFFLSSLTSDDSLGITCQTEITLKQIAHHHEEEIGRELHNVSLEGIANQTLVMLVQYMLLSCHMNRYLL